MPQIKGLRTLKRQAYLHGDELAQQFFADETYKTEKRISIKTNTMNCQVFGWVRGLISDISDDLGLLESTVALVGLIAGFAQSVIWVPERYGDLFIGEIYDFSDYLTNRVADASGIPLRSRELGQVDK